MTFAWWQDAFIMIDEQNLLTNARAESRQITWHLGSALTAPLLISNNRAKWTFERRGDNLAGLDKQFSPFLKKLTPRNIV